MAESCSNSSDDWRTNLCNRGLFLAAILGLESVDISQSLDFVTLLILIFSPIVWLLNKDDSLTLNLKYKRFYNRRKDVKCHLIYI